MTTERILIWHRNQELITLVDDKTKIFFLLKKQQIFKTEKMKTDSPIRKYNTKNWSRIGNKAAKKYHI